MARILVMEDDHVFGYGLKRDLQKAGHEVEVRRSATLAIEELSAQPYDILVTDMIVRQNGQPVPDGGIKLIGWVRVTEHVRNLPIIAITGIATTFWMQDILKTAAQIGANASLQKPFPLIDLQKIIADFMRNNPNDMKSDIAKSNVRATR
jgi:CheY-like chemotaxis protein